MSGYVCRSCRSSLRKALLHRRRLPIASIRTLNSDSLLDSGDLNALRKIENKPESPIDTEVGGSVRPVPLDVDDLLSKPTWSVRSLLPDPNTPPEDQITSDKLHHLLRLSALPLPKSPEAEAKILEDLHSQLHFVRDIQRVNTDGVEPLRSIRDETPEGMEEIEVTMKRLKEAFAKEEIKGRNRRPRRRRGGGPVDTKGVEDWDVFGNASETMEMNGAKYFVVRSGKEPPSADILSTHHGHGEEQELPREENVSSTSVPLVYEIKP